jgi:long-chain fatty acid transport protein
LFNREGTFKVSLIKKTSLAVVAFATAGVFVATEAQATEGYFQNALGARHKGMAGAGVANTKDATAITLNPAGLVHAGRQFNGAASLFMPFRQYKATAPAPFVEFIAGGTVKSKANIFIVPNIAYSHPLDENSVVGFSLSGNGGMNTTYGNVTNGACASPPFPATSGVFCGGKAGVDLTQVNISLAYARQLGQYFSVGVSPIFAVQRFKATGIGAFGGVSSNPTKLSNNGYDYSFGIGVRVGAEFSPTENLRVGASYQSRTLMSRFKKYAGLFAERGDFDVPANFQIGAAYDVTPDLTLMVDYRRIMYSGVNSIANLNPSGLLGTTAGSGFGWKDVNTYKFGVEYTATDALRLRAGYSYNTSPIRKTQIAFNILAPATSKHHITAGASYQFSPNSELEFAAMFSPNAKKSGFVGIAGQRATIKMHQIELTVGYNYKWN